MTVSVRAPAAVLPALGDLLGASSDEGLHERLAELVGRLFAVSRVTTLVLESSGTGNVEVWHSTAEELAAVLGPERPCPAVLSGGDGDGRLSLAVSGVSLGAELEWRLDGSRPVMGAGEKPLGGDIVVLLHDRPGGYGDLDEWRAVCAAACRNVRARRHLDDELGTSLAKLEAINFIGELIGSLDLDVLLSKLMEISLFLSNAQVGSVFLDEGGELQSRVEWGLTLDHALGLRFTDGESILERTIRTREPQLIEDYRDPERFMPVDGVVVLSYLSVPLVSKGRVLGAINLINPETPGGRFTETDKDSIFTIAGLAATTIENAILHQDSLEKERITEGLRIAQTIQNGMYPKERPQVDGYEVAWLNFSCDETGGDYFDFIETSGGALFIAIGDVVGHGIGAALLMATARANLRALCSTGSDLEAVMARLNRFLERDMDAEKFMTMFLSRLDTATHRLEYVNAGHDNPVLFRAADGTTVDLDTTGLPTGIFADMDYRTEEVEAIEIGDALLLTTDGIWEARNAAREIYGKDRLRETFARHAGGASRQILEAVHGDVVEFVGGEGFADDVTMVVVKRTA